MEYNNTEATTTSIKDNTACIALVPTFALKVTSDITNVFQALETLVEEATFVMNGDGISIRTMDPSHVGLIDVNLPNSCFEKYTTEMVETKVGFNVEELVKLLKRFDQKDYIEFTIVDGKLYLKQAEQKASMRLIESASGNTPLPHLNFNAEFQLGKDGMKKMLKFLDYEEYVKISTDSNTVTLTSKTDYTEFEHKYDKSNYLEEVLVKDNSVATYSGDYIKKVLRVLSTQHDSVKVEYSTKMPMRLEARSVQSWDNSLLPCTESARLNFSFWRDKKNDR